MAQEKEIISGTRDDVRKISTRGPEVYMIPLNSIELREQFNAAREVDPEHQDYINELADSILANGFYRHKPLVGRITSDKKAILSDGHTRYAAVLLANERGAGIEAVPFMLEAKGTNEEDRLVGLVVNNSGRRLTPLGEAMVVKELLGRGLSEQEIARRLSRSITKVLDSLTLMGSPPTVREMVKNGEVSATTAISVIKEQGDNAEQVLQNAKKTALSMGKVRSDGTAKVTAKTVGLVSAPRARQRKSNGSRHTDTTRLDWFVRIGASFDKEAGQFVVRSYEGVSLAKDPDYRLAIDKAMGVTLTIEQESEQESGYESEQPKPEDEVL